jgi:hypothetical protein
MPLDGRGHKAAGRGEINGRSGYLGMPHELRERVNVAIPLEHERRERMPQGMRREVEPDLIAQPLEYQPDRVGLQRPVIPDRDEERRTRFSKGHPVGEIFAKQDSEPARYGNHPVLSSFPLDYVYGHVPAILVGNAAIGADASKAHVLKPKIRDLLPPQSGEEHQRNQGRIAVRLKRIRVFQLPRCSDKFFCLFHRERLRQRLREAWQLNADSGVRFHDVALLQVTEEESDVPVMRTERRGPPRMFYSSLQEPVLYT